MTYAKLSNPKRNPCRNANPPLVISTNLDGNAIKDRYGIRTIDRFREMSVGIKYDGQSYRK